MMGSHHRLAGSQDLAASATEDDHDVLEGHPGLVRDRRKRLDKLLEAEPVGRGSLTGVDLTSRFTSFPFRISRKAMSSL